MPSYTQDFVTHHTPNWEKWLGEFKGAPTQGLEIGTFEGRGAVWFMENILTNPLSRLTCVDNFTTLGNSKSRLLYNLKDAKVDDRVTLLEISSRDVVLPKDCYSFAYVDGSHLQQDVLRDALLAFYSVHAGGVIIFDDYLKPIGGSRLQVKKGVDAFLTVFCESIEVIHQAYQVCVRRTK